MPAKKSTRKPAKKSTAKKSTTKKVTRSTSSAKKVTSRSVTFSFFAPDAQSVSLAGSFNDWNPGKHELKQKKDGTWTKAVRLKPGRHEYLFVIDGHSWQCDQNPDECCPNEFGSVNCVKHV